MDKNKIIGIAGVIVVVLVAYFLAAGEAPEVKQNLVVEPTSTAPVSETSSGVANKPTSPAVKSKVINIKSAIFTPASLIVKAGTTVTWINNDAVPHTIVSNSGNLLNSGKLVSGKSFSFKFVASGVYTYHCDIHPMMKGAIIVEN
jgi:plastocyanin